MSSKAISPEEQAKLQTYLDDVMAKAKKALVELESRSQEQIDSYVKACGKVVFDNAEEFAKFAVEETGMGIYDHKVLKNKNKSRNIWWSLKGKKSVGVIEREADTGLVKVAKPVGVVGAITPMTNPNVTPMSNAMFAIKGRNPIIVAPHPRALKTGIQTVEAINKELKSLGAPDNTIQILTIPSMELVQMMTSAVDVVIATGGMAMVKSVYSSGKPALGVGAGNVQVLMDSGINYEEAAKFIIAGRGFDNGIICSGEQSVMVPKADADKIIDLFGKNGAYVVKNNERDKLRETIFPGGSMNKDLVGQSAKKIGDEAGINVPDGTQILLVEAESGKDILGSEKMYPVLTLFRYDNWNNAIEIANNNMAKAGKGHTVAVHSKSQDNIEKVALSVDVARVVVNAPSSFTAGGSWQNSLAPTNTLGCGSWGNNSISENLTYTHLINVQRVAYKLEDRCAPSDEKIWE